MIIMGFSLNLRSVDGYFVGPCMPAVTLSDATIGGAPQESITDMPMWSLRRDGNTESLMEWEHYYRPALIQSGELVTMQDFYDYLTDNGYDFNNKLPVAVFNVVDEQGTNTGLQLCLMAYSAGGNNITYQMQKRTLSQGVYTYTNVSNARTENTYNITEFGMVCGMITKLGKQWYSFGFATHYANYTASAVLFGNTTEGLTELLGGTVPGQKVSPEYGPESEPGGYGPGSGGAGGSGGPAPTFDGTSDPWVDTPTKPGVLSFGLLNVYKCDQGALNNLGAALFPEITWPPSSGFSDLIEWLGMTIEAFSDSIWNKGLIDYIVSVHLIPVDVQGGSLEDIKIGPRTMTGTLARPISSDVIEIDCGSVHVDEYYTNYVDYMTQCRVYIPFYGMVSIKPEYWQSADISLKYLWNVMDGSFIAKLYSTITRHQSPCTTMIGQYSGSACVHMPLSGANYANMFSQLAGGVGGAAAGIASGNVAMAATSAMNYAGAVGSTGNMEQSNAYNASSAFYGHSRPFLIIERPVSHFSSKYVEECGLPVLVTKRIGACSGLTICEDPILNFACPDDEAEAIKAALKEGVIV